MADMEQLRRETAAAGLDLAGADIAAILPLWLDNLPRRAWLRGQTFALTEPPFCGHPPPPRTGPFAGAATDFIDADDVNDAPDPTALDLGTLALRLARRTISSREIVESHLRRVARFDGVVRTTAHLMAEEALAAARASDARRARGEALSPLDGVPIGVKDCIAVAGAPMRGGSRAYVDHAPRADSPAIAALRAAGVIPLAKQRMHELGAGPAIADGADATGRNPYDIARIPGGSSSGSAAAVAAGFVPGALGTDAAGSVRIPAAFCGLAGLKPTFGAIPTQGCLPLTWSLDTIGTLARDVSGAGLLFAAASGQAPPALDRSLRGARLGVLRRYYVDAPDLDDDMRAAFDEAARVFAALGAELATVDIPSIDRNDVGYTTLLAESFAIHGRDALARPSLLSDWFRAQVLTAALFSADDVLRARRYQSRLLAESLEALEGCDALIHPGMAGPPSAFGNVFITALTQPRSRFTRPWNVTGLPALALPCGRSRDGMPLSLQLVGRPHEEATILAIGRAFERETPWRRLRPDPSRWRAD